MHLDIDRQRDTPIFLQIVEALERKLAGGEIRDGSRLPASRDLARNLGVNRNTVVSAYAELVARGRATAHTGRGTFLRAAAVADTPLRWHEALARGADARGIGDTLDLHSVAVQDVPFAFASNFPPEDLLPAADFGAALNEVILARGARLLTYGTAAGYPPLRQWIADEMGRRGDPVGAESVIVTTGSQQGIDLAARAILSPGDVVLMEEPGFTLAFGAFQAHGARVEGIPVDHDGIRADLLEQAVVRSRPKLLYLVPNFQNPTGVCLSATRRQEVLEIAERHAVPIVEDDSSGALRFAGTALPSLHSRDRRGQVLYLSTFSKKLLPALRVGWICVPEAIRDRLVGLKQVTDCTTSLLLQAALDAYCRSGKLEGHLRRVRAAYRERRDAMVEALASHLPAGSTWTVPDGGLLLWVTLPEGVDAKEILREALAQGVSFNPGALFFIEPTRSPHMRLTFGGNPPETIREGIRILGEIADRACARTLRSRPAARGEAAPLL